MSLFGGGFNPDTDPDFGIGGPLKFAPGPKKRKNPSAYALATFSDLGLRVVDMEGNIVWEYPVKGVMLYGCDVDPVTGNIYGSLYNKIIEVTQAGNKVWEYTHPRLKGLHSLQAVGKGQVLVTCTPYDCALWIDKKKGIVDEWNFNQHFKKPKFLGRNMWTHINFAEQHGDTLFITSAHPPDVRGKPNKSEVLIVRSGEIDWRWLEVAEKENIPVGAHCFKRFHENYLLSDTAGQRVMEVTATGMVRRVFDFAPMELKPRMVDWATINGRTYVIIPTSPVRGSKEFPKLLWVDWEKQEIVSSVSENITHIFCARYLPEWSAELTEDEEEKIMDRLRALGYIE